MNNNTNNTQAIETYVNGERTFEVDLQTKDERGYVLLKDISYGKDKGYFYVPNHVIENFKPGKQ